MLSSGAVMVDLPGVRDSNAARNNIASNYLKTCNTIWIVANITRYLKKAKKKNNLIIIK